MIQTNVNAEQFQRAFCKLYSDQIQRLIRESRQEAFEQAKKILKDRALTEYMQTGAVGEQQKPSDAAETTSPSSYNTVLEKSPVDKGLSDNHAHRPALSDRILEEIEAIREQILRNEELLSQIKPLIGSQQATEDKR